MNICSNCLICGKIISVKPSQRKLGWGKYCSISCRNTSQRKGKYFNCGICGKQVYKSISKQKNSKSGKYFCTKSCQTLWRNNFYSGNKSMHWKDGHKIYRKTLMCSGVKRACILCGIHNTLILTAHHKDHNRNNNGLENLAWLCLNCHYLVHHDAELDKKVRKWVYLKTSNTSFDIRRTSLTS